MTKHLAVENTKPEKFAEVLLEFIENPDLTLNRLAEDTGLAPKTIAAIRDRMAARYQPVVEEIGRITTGKLVERIEQKLPMLLDGITQKKVNDATLRDIAVAFGVLAEKRQLLNGEPTHILTYQERTAMNELGPAILKELERRGMAVDVDFEEVPMVNVTNPDIIPDEALSRTAANQARKKKRAQNR